MGKPLRVKCNRAGATEGCKPCPHSEEHDEVIYTLPPGTKISHKPPHTCSEGGKVRCLPVKSGSTD